MKFGENLYTHIGQKKLDVESTSQTKNATLDKIHYRVLAANHQGTKHQNM